MLDRYKVPALSQTKSGGLQKQNTELYALRSEA
jgi:hypothetical protein